MHACMHAYIHTCMHVCVGGGLTTKPDLSRKSKFCARSLK